MTPDADDRDLSSPPSLAAQVAGWMHGLRPSFSMWPREAAGSGYRRWVVPALALLIPAGPLATLTGAALLTSVAQRDSASMEAKLAPRRNAEQGREAARTVLMASILRPGPAALLDSVAAALPADATLVRAERRADGTLELEVSVSDPDALRGAVRRVPALSGLRDVRQQEGDGRTLVLLRQAAP